MRKNLKTIRKGVSHRTTDDILLGCGLRTQRLSLAIHARKNGAARIEPGWPFRP